jgi:hypothetical protein
MPVSISIRHRGGRIKALIEGLEGLEQAQGEIYLRKPRRNVRLARFMRNRGHDPLAVDLAVRRAAKAIIAAAIKKGRKPTARKSLRDAAKLIRKELQDRIKTGRLGTNAPSTIKKKMYLLRKRKATARYGVPPPYGVQTGQFVAAIQARLVTKGR